MKAKFTVDEFVKDYLELKMNNYVTDFGRKYGHKLDQLPDFDQVVAKLTSDENVAKLIDDDNDMKRTLLFRNNDKFKVVIRIPDDRKIVIEEIFFDNLVEAAKFKLNLELDGIYNTRY